MLMTKPTADKNRCFKLIASIVIVFEAKITLNRFKPLDNMFKNHYFYV